MPELMETEESAPVLTEAAAAVLRSPRRCVSGATAPGVVGALDGPVVEMLTMLFHHDAQQLEFRNGHLSRSEHSAKPSPKQAKIRRCSFSSERAAGCERVDCRLESGKRRLVRWTTDVESDPNHGLNDAREGDRRIGGAEMEESDY